MKRQELKNRTKRGFVPIMPQKQSAFNSLFFKRLGLEALFIVGLITGSLTIGTYQETIIPWAYLLAIWITSGLIFTPVLYNTLKNLLEINSIFKHIGYNVVTWGGFVLFGFITINQAFPGNKTMIGIYDIDDKGNIAKGLYGCGNAYANIHYQGKSKELVFGCDINLQYCNRVKLYTKEGFFGFDIIMQKEPIN